jgi:hypothetical protein
MRDQDVQNWQSLGLLDIVDDGRDILIQGYPAFFILHKQLFNLLFTVTEKK